MIKCICHNHHACMVKRYLDIGIRHLLILAFFSLSKNTTLNSSILTAADILRYASGLIQTHAAFSKCQLFTASSLSWWWWWWWWWWWCNLWYWDWWGMTEVAGLGSGTHRFPHRVPAMDSHYLSTILINSTRRMLVVTPGYTLSQAPTRHQSCASPRTWNIFMTKRSDEHSYWFFI